MKILRKAKNGQPVEVLKSVEEASQAELIALGEDELRHMDNYRTIYLNYNKHGKLMHGSLRDPKEEPDNHIFSVVDEMIEKYDSNPETNNSAKIHKQVASGYWDRQYWTKYDGSYINLRQLSVRTGINYNTIKGRYRHGTRGADLYLPVKKRVAKGKYNGKSYTVQQLSTLFGIKYSTMFSRVKRGCTDEQLSAPTSSEKKLPNFDKIADTYHVDRDTIKKRYFSQNRRGNDLFYGKKTPTGREPELYVKIDGEKYSLTQISKKYNIKRSTLYYRYHNLGIEDEKILLKRSQD